MWKNNSAKDDMRTEIRKITKDMGVTSLFVTHDQSEAMSMSDSIVVMNCGRIEQRLVENALRNGVNDFTLRKWKAYLDLKKYFDEKCGNIYDIIKVRVD